MVNSLVWSPEEAKYLKAIFHWQETEPALEEERRRQQAEEDERKREQEQKPAGEFRVLVIGGQGTGKTAILTRVSTPIHGASTALKPRRDFNRQSIQFGEGIFHGETLPPDPFYERGCRHPITLEVSTPALPPSATAHALTTNSPTTTMPTPRGTTTKSYSQPNINSQQPNRLYKQPPNHNKNNHHHQQLTPLSPLQKQPQTATKPQTQTYLIDALEMPTAHLPSNPLLAQALSITEAAVLVYSVRDPASLQLARGLAEFMREHFALQPTVTSPGSPGPRPGSVDRGRAYPIVLVGNKRDGDDDGDGGRDGVVGVSRAAGVRAARGMGVGNGVGGNGVNGVVGNGGGRGGGSGVDVPFMEVSAKTGEGVDELFELVGREVLRVRRAVRERREVAERERLMSAVGSVQTAGGEGRRRWRALWRALFGRGAEVKR
jgi:GTPase SAR1 family protein